ncbi:MAG: hypothetical protein WCV99_03065 [Sterolibacterium sp.]|jgi:hypothetical protein
MKVKVRPLRNSGRMLRNVKGVERPCHVGNLCVTEGRDVKLARAVIRARLVDIASGTQVDILPELLDARLLWAEDNKWRLTGIERIDDVDYAQTWSVEIA